MTTDRYGLGRIPEFDERSRSFSIGDVLPPVKARSYTWSCGVHLNQGGTGHCVGFAWAAELAAKPVVVPGITDAKGHEIYHRAQTLDQWPGENYEGSSTLGGAKAVTQEGYLTEYRWAFNIEDFILALGHHGPAVIGVNWYSSMFSPNSSGEIVVNGTLEGGHDILANGIKVVWQRKPVTTAEWEGWYSLLDYNKTMFRLHNSWGDWGINGECFINVLGMARLLGEQADVCIPVHRANP